MKTSAKMLDWWMKVMTEDKNNYVSALIIEQLIRGLFIKIDEIFD